MRRALVVGASGGMGASLTKELAERGIEVVAFARNGKKLESLHGCNPLVTIAAGDAFEKIRVTKFPKISRNALTPKKAKYAYRWKRWRKKRMRRESLV
ncbi:hypothetical protein BSNK01_08130 [Bacillaceae bacterium]